MSDHPLLRIDHVSSRFAGGSKLADISLSVQRGELVSILGANGAGKSTLLGVIAGLYRPSSGRIVLEDRDITGLPAHQVVRAGVALAPQNHPVFENMSVADNLALIGEGREEQILSLFPNLAAKRQQRAGRLSGGERQMLSMAQAMLTMPKICLFDEPSSGLAPKIVHEVFQTIRMLVDRGTTVLMVEQNARAALELADRAYVLEQGRIVLSGSSNEISANDHVRRAYLGL